MEVKELLDIMNIKTEGINIYDLSEIINVANGIKIHENLFLQKTKFIKLTDLYGQTH